MLVQILNDQSRSEPVNILCQTPGVPRISVRYVSQRNCPATGIQTGFITYHTSPLG